MPKIPLEHGIPDKYEFQKWMGQYPRECVRWLPPEEQELERAYKDGVSVPELARRHGRRESGITSRLSRLLGQAFIEEYIFNNKQPQVERNKMNQNDLHIRYLEDALNHAKTGEPMKCWQVRSKNVEEDYWVDIRESRFIPNEEFLEDFEIRTKPEPFKWTAYACWYYINSTRYVYFDTVKGHHVSLEDLRRKFPHLNIIAVHHHEVDVDD